MHSQDGIGKKTREMQHSPLKVSPCQPLSSTARSGSPTAGNSQPPENWGPCDISQPGTIRELANEPDWWLPHELAWSNCRAAPHCSMYDPDLAAHQKFSCQPWLLPWPRTLPGSTFFPNNTLDNKESGFPIKRLLGRQTVSTYNQKEKVANDAARVQWNYASLHH